MLANFRFFKPFASAKITLEGLAQDQGEEPARNKATKRPTTDVADRPFTNLRMKPETQLISAAEASPLSQVVGLVAIQLLNIPTLSNSEPKKPKL